MFASLHARLEESRGYTELLNYASTKSGEMAKAALQANLSHQFDRNRLMELVASATASLDWPRVQQLQLDVNRLVEGSELQRAVEQANASLVEQLDWDSIRESLIELQEQVDTAPVGKIEDVFRWIDLLPLQSRVKFFLIVMAVLNNLMMIAAQADGAALPQAVAEVVDTLLLMAGYLADRLPKDNAGA